MVSFFVLSFSLSVNLCPWYLGHWNRTRSTVSHHQCSQFPISCFCTIKSVHAQISSVIWCLLPCCSCGILSFLLHSFVSYKTVNLFSLSKCFLLLVLLLSALLYVTAIDICSFLIALCIPICHFTAFNSSMFRDANELGLYSCSHCSLQHMCSPILYPVWHLASMQYWSDDLSILIGLMSCIRFNAR